MATATTDYKAMNTQIANVRTYSKKCTFSAGSVILNTNIKDAMSLSNQKFIDFSMKLKTSLMNSISIMGDEIIISNKLKYTNLFDKSISNIFKIKADKFSVEATDDSLLFSVKKERKTAYIDLFFDDINVLYSLISDSEPKNINNYSDILVNTIVSINNFFEN